MIVDTAQLLDIVIKQEQFAYSNTIQLKASLVSSNGNSYPHSIYYEHNKFVDIDSNGDITTYTREEFLSMYTNTKWLIDKE